MNRYLDPSPLGRASLYSRNACMPVSSRIVATLTMHLNKPVLEQVLGEAMIRFPYVSVQLTVSEGDYVLVPSNVPVKVFTAEDECLEFGSEALCFRLFKVTVSDKTVCFDFHHAIADAAGMMVFVKSVLLRYIEASGFRVSNDGSVKLLSGSCVPAEIDEPISRLEDKPASRPVWYMDAKALQVDRSGPASQRVVQVRIPLARIPHEFEMISKEPEPFLLPLISHAVYDAHQDLMGAGEYVVASVQVDLRPYFPSASLLPYHTNVYLAYNRNIDEYPYRTVHMSQKKLLEAQLKTDALAYSVQKQLDELERALAPEDFRTRVMNVDEMLMRKASKATYEVSRVGNVMMPENMQRYISELYPVMTCGPYACAVSLMVYRGEIFATFTGGGDLRFIADRFAGLLNENDIQAFVSDEYDFVPMKGIA